MTEYLHDFIRPRRRNAHWTMVALDRGLKEGYRNGTLVRTKKNRKRRKAEASK